MPAKKKPTKNKKFSPNRTQITLLSIVLYCALLSFGETSGLYRLPNFESFKDSSFQVINGLFGTEPALKSEVIENPTASVHMIDVGQGSSTLIKAGGRNILIDGGESIQGDIVLEYLRANDVTHLDIVIATHPHSDHIGGLAQIINKIPTDKVIVPSLPDKLIPTTRVYQNMLTAVQKRDLKLTTAKAGEVYTLDENTNLEILGPLAEFPNLNDNSIICRLSVGNIRFMFQGDAEESAEASIVKKYDDLRADVFFAGHHGSNTSNNYYYVSYMNPSFVAISVGDDNDYGHPHLDVIKTFSEFSTIYRTDIHGNITFFTDGNRIEAKPASGFASVMERGA